MHVLLVEDNDGDADLVADALGETRNSNLELSRVSRLSTALERLSARRFDLVLLDLSLPDASGLEGLAQIRSAAPNAPIVVLTGLANAAVGTKAIQSGAQDYLHKGQITGSELLRAITYASERAQIVQRAQLLSELSAAIVGARDLDSVFSAVREALSKNYLQWFRVTGADARTSASDQLAVEGPATGVVGQLFSSLTANGLPESQPEQLRELLERGMCSAMVLTFHARGRTPGTLTFARNEEAEAFTASDLTLAEEITRRAVAAIEYAELLTIAQCERERAEVAGRARDEFLATLSHELRTPLNAILGWTVLLRGGKVGVDQVPRALETIERNARSQAALIEDIFEVSRIITGKIRLDLKVVDVALVLASALESIAPAVQSKSLTVAVTGEGNAGSILADPDRLLQIFWNLLSNAMKFTPAGGRLSIQLRRTPDFVDVAVSDTGQGMAPELIPHVFQRFRQGDSTTTRAHGGLGLGLAIVRHLVELHGGTISAESEGVGKGATFTVRLAVTPGRETGDSQARQRQPQASEPFVGSSRLAGLSILVVDDDDDTRTLLATVLEASGASVTSAATAIEGLAMLRAARPDILLSDVGMPGSSGYDLIAQIRQLGPLEGGATPAVALTAYAGTGDRARALSGGFNEYMSKPFSPEKIVSLIDTLAARARASA